MSHYYRYRKGINYNDVFWEEHFALIARSSLSSAYSVIYLLRSPLKSSKTTSDTLRTLYEIAIKRQMIKLVLISCGSKMTRQIEKFIKIGYQQ